MPTTTMALSSPLNPTSLPVTSQVSALKEETASVPQLVQHHDSTTTENAQNLSQNLDESDDLIKANGNGNNLKNGAVTGLLTAEHGSPKASLHSPITIGTTLSGEIDVDLNMKGSDMSCLNVVTSSSPTSLSSAANNNHFLNGANGHLLMAQSGGASLNFQASNSPDSPWSIGEVENSGFVNYSSTNNGQMHKRPIMSQQPHHGLSPNSSSSIARNNASQQYIHYNKNNGNNSNNFAAPWSNSGPNSPWQQHQQQQQMHHHQQHQHQLLHQSSSQTSLSNWNRGRSAPSLNPLSPHVPHQRKHQTPTQYSMPPSASSSQGLSPIPQNHSPSKYRRSTSYPGKNQNIHGYHAVSGIIEDQNYMSYQDHSMDMRSLEHCLNDITNTAGVQSDLKGFLNCNSTTLQSLAQLQGKLDFHEFIPGKPFYQNEDQTEESGGFLESNNIQIGSPARSSPHSQGSDNGERFSRKVFVGGLPPDIDEDEITSSFRRYGPLIVDWPHKAESKSYFPPKGYAFLLFQDECSVQNLIENCIIEDDKLYICVSSPTIKNKPVQIRPWRLSDADFVLDASMSLDPRKTVFVGGVPRPLKALELAMIMDRLYGGVCYAGIDTDPELKYPKGAGRVAFSNQQSYIAAISARFVQLQHGDIDKRVEVKPYVLDDQMCDECGGQRCSGKFAPFFCANVTCLQYYCEHCWATIHSRPGREYHKPLVKEGADRPRAVPFRWC